MKHTHKYAFILVFIKRADLFIWLHAQNKCSVLISKERTGIVCKSGGITANVSKSNCALPPMVSHAIFI